MEGSKTFAIENVIPSDYPDEIKRESLKLAERKVGNQLFDILWQFRLPAVVDIDEKIEEKYHYNAMYFPNDVIRIKVTITPVQYRDVTIANAYPQAFRLEYHENIFKKIYRKLRNLKW